MSGANRFAVAAEQSIKSDVYLIGACSFIGVATLFFLFIGGWRAFLIVSVPPLVGILVANNTLELRLIPPTIMTGLFWLVPIYSGIAIIEHLQGVKGVRG